jgi:hypothetical protein
MASRPPEGVTSIAAQKGAGFSKKKFSRSRLTVHDAKLLKQ